ncbi:sugar ABC transporter ATP-binding protein [Oceanithermus sp.]|uniref:sugar ABC transporter ATP-binding protein n=1 Tax=Oceanithermus sp. TaxID=2268145 RepID=UPI0025FDA9E4|nr:sugar ABC transporter ATP-binding protein [Oceanithermus sp.]
MAEPGAPGDAASEHPPDERTKTDGLERGNGTPLLELENVWKVFAGVPVLRGIDFTLHEGEIHALLGGNGSGKSTTMKIISGAYALDAGTMRLRGEPVRFDSPKAAHDRGVYMVPQEPHVFPHLSVLENLGVGLGLSPTELRARVEPLLEGLGFQVDLNEQAAFLSIAQQQLLEIMRGLLRHAQVLIFDEPTSALTFRETEHLFDRMRRLAAQGIGLIFISHRLGEVMEIADRISVLRDGVVVLSDRSSALTPHDLVRAMLPEAAEREQETAAREARGTSQGPAVLEVKDLSSEAFSDVSFTLHAGEVLGLAGLVGSGRTEVCEAIVGIDSHARGEVRVNGQPLARRSPAICQRHGLVYVPEDRHAHGIFLDLPSLYTMSASILDRLGRLFLATGEERAIGERFVRSLNIKLNDLNQIAGTLSGGNQQKVVLAKALAGEPRVVLLDEPTRGIDASARQDVYHLIRQLTAEGVAVLLISSELEEIVDLSDRVLVMYRGRITEELTGDAITLERVTDASFGLPQGEEVAS